MKSPNGICQEQNGEQVLCASDATFTISANPTDSTTIAVLPVRTLLTEPIVPSHQMLGSRSKYSSSSFLPPSPLPSTFSDSMNSIRSIHLTIL